LPINRIEKNETYNPYPGLDAMFQLDENISVDEDMGKAQRKYRLLLHFGTLQAPTTPGETKGISGKAILKYWRLKQNQMLRKERQKLDARSQKFLEETILPLLERLEKKIDRMEKRLPSIEEETKERTRIEFVKSDDLRD